MIAIIPARGGSKSIPKKNIALLDGIPLIAYPIIEAKKSEYISDIYVSTDCKEIADISTYYGAKIIKRPAEFSTDDSLDIDVFKHAFWKLGSYDDVIHLRATTPLIEVKIIDKAIKYYFKNHDCTSMRSAHEIPESIQKFFKKDGKYFKGIFDDIISKKEYYNLSRQNLEKTYKPNGYIDILKPSVFMKSNSLHGDKILAFETPFTVEVDSMEEIEYLEFIIKNKKK